ncbi:bifunctional biotin--[acetyl-CoA-carboxylase] ligase/biotin operon repressor BirA [Pseudomonas sp. N040]|uniref:bifunctional biotin--[acetyl-CoA-carboxylase] ligase/biotin operon repressor BirA n=1 Tax=Pseudomonas sp. N040 TaxID=2785325 RepID=UPI0018A2C4F0|nr:bifunctional biotin--[acetyl-CoA-carboxylase] ligase/biotin operon repressor BirA [Pseudomonas sp. N040]MBF7731734.1 bifunctional biotin--[acetyl-CoA-carboxylase] ligase/biotin operon repressor BirA [Pseudomonas sp. N040]MBW7015378.1 bifunctional biotin--[acetyl-CoA-carboxylase] ligase/biotin operon repressor BirA [Pseudomonas sp. N040]
MSALMNILQDGRFHSGEEIGALLAISRSAVWKKIKRLKAERGVNIHCVKGRGYKLADRIIALDPPGYFSGEHLSWRVDVLQTLDSTNAEAFRRLAASVPAPFAIVTEQQTAGRGRRGRIWISPFGENLYFTLALRVDQGIRQLEGLSLVVGLAVVNSLKSVGVADVGLKWPNDVLASGQKIAGILLELAGDVADACHVIIGIGINANMLNAGQEIDQKWTSIRQLSGAMIDRNVLLSELQRQIDGYLGRHSAGGFSALQAEWEVNHLWQLRPVILSSGEKKITGTVVGVDSSGALRLLVDGIERKFSGGELSLRLQDDS